MKPQGMDAKADLHYSPDEGCWYFQHYDVPSKLSQDFPTKAEALRAWYEHRIEWHKI